MNNPTILCIDDERNVLFSLRNQLIRHFPDYTIEIAESSDEALALIHELIADGIEIPLVIADQIMPGKKGDALLIELHARYPQILKVMLTGQANAEDVGNVVNRGELYHFIAKPWNEANLILTVTEALRRYRQEQQLAQQQSALEQANRELEALNATLEHQVQERTQQLQAALTSLQQTNAEMQAIFNASPDLLFRMDAEGTILNYQAGQNEDFYFPPETGVGKQIQAALPPKVQALFNQAIERTLVTKALVSFEYQLPIGSSQEDFEGRLVPFQGNQVILTVRKITDRKRVETALRDSEAQYRRIVETANEGIWIIDPENRTSFVNSKMAEMLGQSVEAMTGKSLLEFMDESGKAIASQNIERRRQGIVEQHDFKFQHKNGTDVWAMLSVNPITDDSGQYAGALAMVTDITTRKQSETALADSEEKFRQLAENIHQVFFIHDVASRQVLYVSPSFETIWGIPCDRLYADPEAYLESVHPEDHAHVKAIFETQDLESLLGLEYRIIKADQIRWIRARTFPIRNRNGQVYRIAGIAEDVTGQKQIELEMAQSRDLREVIFNESADALFLVDPDTSITIDCNERAVALFEANGKDALMNIQGDVLQRSRFTIEESKQIKAEIEAYGIWSREIEYITLRGKIFWGNLAAKRINVTGKRLHLVRVTDISDRKHFELALQQLNEELEQRVQQRTQELQQQTQLLQTILNSIGDGLLVADTKGNIILHNPAAEAITGLGAPTANLETWQSFWGIYLPNGTPCPIEQLPLVRAIRGESADRLEVILRNIAHPEGIHVEATIRPLLDVANTPVGGVAVFRDISDRKQAEVAIRTSQERLRAALSASGTGTFRWDIQTNILEWDDNLNYLFGLPADKTIYTLSEFIALVYPDDRAAVVTTCKRCVEAGIDFEQEFRVVWPDGTMHWLFDQGKVFFDQNNYPLYVAGACVDITERKRAEAALRQLNTELEQRVEERTLELKAAKEIADAANQAKSDFLANMSHELRTPLNGVLGYAQILRRDTSLTSKQQEACSIIYSCGNQLLTLISDILELSKIEARKLDLHPQDFAFSPFLEEVIELCHIRAQQKQIDFTFAALSPLPAAIHADAKHLRQVLLNLIGNAIKFTDRGTVSFTVAAFSQSSVPNTSSPRIHLRFQVEDTGVGMTAIQLNKIFLPFEQVCDRQHQIEGTGLGLAISEQIVRLMGSHIQVESFPGQGSCFWFEVEVPIANLPPTSCTDQDTGVAIVGYRGERRKILVVDDAEENRSVIVNLLEPLGFELLEAENGQIGWERAMTWHPDLLIIDLRMPDIDGLTLTKRLRQQPELEQVVIVISSASVFEADQHRSIAAGADAFLAKPIEVAALLQQVKHWLQLEWVDQTEWTYAADGREPMVQPLHTTRETDRPPLNLLNKLYDLAIRGRITAIEREIAALEQANPQWSRFLEQVTPLVQTCQIDQLRQFLRQLLEES